MRRREIVGGAAIFLFGAITALLSVQMPVGTLRMAGSGLFPLCLGILLMALSAILMVKVLWSSSDGLSQEQKEEQTGKDTATKEEPGSWLPVVAFLTIMALATLLLPTLGYFFISFALMVGLLITLGLRRWPFIFALSFLVAAGSHVLFVYMLKIPLPKGLPGI